MASRPLALLLRLGELEVAEFTTPEQTETPGRWKVALATGGAEPVRTKIEFSGREGEGQVSFSPLPAEVLAPYALPAPSVQHYAIETATVQKVEALVGRSETQARDVFDLDLLLRRRARRRAARSGCRSCSRAAL